MVSADLIASKTAYGYGKAAAALGRSTVLYRPLGPTDPITAGNVFGTRLAALDTVPQFTFVNPQKFGNPIFYAAMDGTGLLPGDYLVQGGLVYFVAVLNDFAAPEVVNCNRRISLLRTRVPVKAGVGGYGGSTAATDALLMASWPASVLEKGRGDRNDMLLPGDKKIGQWIVLLPISITSIPRTSDIITDDEGQRFVVNSAEQSFMGWRLLVQEVAA
jgi:hypothetical protein